MDAADPVAALVQGNNAFALDLYARLGQGDGNRFISPFSISTALAMTYVGAQDETALQMAKALRFTLPPSQLHPAFHKLIAELHGRNAAQVAPDRPADVQLFTANALWTQAGERILRRLPEANRDQLPGRAVSGRLPAMPPRKRGKPSTPGSWSRPRARSRTCSNQRISTRKPCSSSPTRSISKALWASPFSKEKTSQEDFHASPSDVVRVDMMKQSGRFRYDDGGSFQALELPYKGNTLAMVILLPKAKDGLGAARIVADGPEDRELALASCHRTVST